MDADEVVPEALAREILSAISDPQSDPVAYSIVRNNFFLGKQMRHGGWARQRATKLYLKKSGRFVGRSVHETLKVAGPLAASYQPSPAPPQKLV